MFDFSKFESEFEAAIKIGGIFHEIAKKRDVWAQDWRHESVNPFYNRTEQGLFLEFYYGVPGTLWTPWGKYKFCGSSSSAPITFDALTGDLLERVRTTPFQEKKTSYLGEFGPARRVLSLDGVLLPEPRISRDIHGFEPGFYDAAKEDWARRMAESRK